MTAVFRAIGQGFASVDNLWIRSDARALSPYNHHTTSSQHDRVRMRLSF